MGIINRLKNLISSAEVGAVASTSFADKTCAWAKKIASDNSWHYVRYTGDKKTHECPICHKHSKGKYYGGNCIWYAFATWRHGGGLKSKCSCQVITDAHWNKILKASDKEALTIAQDRIGIKSIKVIRNGGKVIPTDKLQKGDIIAFFDGNTYKHTALYIGNGKMSDCSGGQTPNIKYGINIRKTCKVAIRYTGDKSVTPTKKHYTGTYPSLTITKNGKTVTKPIKKGEKSDRVRHLELFLAWYGYKIIADGIYGDKTLAVVKKFQKAKGIKPTGTVGKKTIAAMKEVVR